MRWQDPELQARLAEMSASGLSAAKIAAALGETRGAVLQAMIRYGLFAGSGRGRRRRRIEISNMGQQWQSN